MTSHIHYYVVVIALALTLVQAAPLIPQDMVEEASGFLDISGIEFFDILFGEKGIVTSLINHGAKLMHHSGANVKLQDGTFVASNVDPNDLNLGVGENTKGGFLPPVLDGLWRMMREIKYGEPDLEALPPMGGCDEETCQEIYARLDSFRRSDLFLNLQTALELMQDKDGLKFLAELLSKPELLQQLWPLPKEAEKGSQDEPLTIAKKSNDIKMPDIMFSGDDYYDYDDYDNSDYYEYLTADRDGEEKLGPIPIRSSSPTRRKGSGPLGAFEKGLMQMGMPHIHKQQKLPIHVARPSLPGDVMFSHSLDPEPKRPTNDTKKHRSPSLTEPVLPEGVVFSAHHDDYNNYQDYESGMQHVQAEMAIPTKPIGTANISPSVNIVNTPKPNEWRIVVPMNEFRQNLGNDRSETRSPTTTTTKRTQTTTTTPATTTTTTTEYSKRNDEYYELYYD